MNININAVLALACLSLATILVGAVVIIGEQRAYIRGLEKNRRLLREHVERQSEWNRQLSLEVGRLRTEMSLRSRWLRWTLDEKTWQN